MKQYDFDTTKFLHQTPIQMRFSDLDALNHVNNGFQMHYFDVGRINYFADVLKREIDWTKDFLVLVHLELDFIAPIEMGMDVYVQTKTIGFGQKSMRMFQRIIDKKTMEVKSTCFSILSGFNREKQTSESLPQEYLDTFLAFENT
ncbi:MAG: hotdog domain-containing protein [Bacteroidota bacterium]|nr:hotdog domain-containing protein [Bacteroidota bacterium]